MLDAALKQTKIIAILLLGLALHPFATSADVVPHLAAETVVADYRDDYQGTAPAAGWTYAWNAPLGWVAGGSAGNGASNPIGTAAHYAALQWNGSIWTPDGDTTFGNNQPAGYLHLNASGGHPGLGSTQTGGVGNSLDRFAIAGFTVTAAGDYRISDSLFSGSSGLDVLLYVDDAPVVSGGLDNVNTTGTFSFDGAVGTVSSGQTVYVAVGPHGNAGMDAFSLDYTLVLETGNALTGDQSESDTDLFFVPERSILLNADLEVDRLTPGAAVFGPHAPAETNTLASGSYVASSLFHFDPVTGGSVTGNYTFAHEVVAVIWSASLLDATDDLLGDPTLAYPSDGGITIDRGGVNEATDQVTLSADRRTVSLVLYASGSNHVDQVRVLTRLEAPPDLDQGLVANPSGEFNSGVSGDAIAGGAVPGWNGDGGQVLKGDIFAGNGRWRLSIEDDESIYQVTEHAVSTGAAFSLRFDAAGFSGSPPSVTADLVAEWPAGGGHDVIATRTFSFAPVEAGNWQHLQLVTDYGALDAYAGRKIGVRFSGPASGSNRFLSVDAVRLEAFSAPAAEARFSSAWTNAVDRIWAGEDFWANRLQDWDVAGQKLRCLYRWWAWRTCHITTARLEARPQDFTVRVRTGLHLGSTDADSFAGVLVGAGPRLDPRGACLVSQQGGQDGGLLVGLDGRSRPVFRDLKSSTVPVLASDGAHTSWQGDADLELVATFDGSAYDLVLTARRVSDNTLLGQAVLHDVEAAHVLGNVALVSHKGANGSTFWYQRLELTGGKVGLYPESATGPILSAQHTLSRGTMSMAAQLQPVADGVEITNVTLQVYRNAAWHTVQVSPVENDAYVALFRVNGWDDTADVPYRLLAGVEGLDGSVRTQTWAGVVAKDPRDEDEIVIAGFTGNMNIANAFSGLSNPQGAPVDWTPEYIVFPHAEVSEHVAIHDPHLLFFSGDQVYESGSPTGADTSNYQLDYLYKWYLWCWAYRDLTRDLPCITIPDDHDVFQGNLWGQGGRPATVDNQGGYVRPAWFVKMVEKTQTANLPLPYDPTPVDQGIGVYYTSMNLGEIGIAVVEDRKWKIGSQSAEASSSDPADLVQYGQRQLDFLDNWSRSWSNEVMKTVLSQTVLGQTTTHGQETYQYVTWVDRDSNGWPAVGRNRAVDQIRRGFSFMIGGDQHLATVVHHGIDTYRDAGIHFCVPSILNAFPRVWDPSHTASGTTPVVSPNLGDYQDKSGNDLSFMAVANPAAYYQGKTSSGVAPASVHDRACGYGIIRFDKPTRRIRSECWPRYAHPERPWTGGMYPDWPITVSQADNYGRVPYGTLPVVGDGTMTNPVLQVIEEASGEVLYTVRVNGTRVRPHVFTNGLYTVNLWDPEAGVTNVFSGQAVTTGAVHEILSFSAQPVNVVSNTMVRFAWDVTGSADLQLSGHGDVDPYTFNGMGFIDLAAQSNATYTLTSTNTLGEMLQTQVVVRVFEPLEDWRARHFTPGELADPGVSGDDADPEGDSICNILEYALTTDPRADSRGDLPALSMVSYPVGPTSEYFLTLVYRGLIEVAGVRYEVQTSQHPSDPGSWQSLDSFSAAQVGLQEGGPGETPTLTMRDTVPVSDYPEPYLSFRLILRYS